MLNAPRNKLSQIRGRSRIASALNRIRNNSSNAGDKTVSGCNKIRISSAPSSNSAGNRIVSANSRIKLDAATKNNSAQSNNAWSSCGENSSSNRISRTRIGSVANATNNSPIAGATGQTTSNATGALTPSSVTRAQTTNSATGVQTTSNATGAQIRSSVPTSIARNGLVSRVMLYSSGASLSSSDAGLNYVTSKGISSACDRTNCVYKTGVTAIMDHPIIAIRAAAVITKPIVMARRCCGKRSTMVMKKASAPARPIARMAGTLALRMLSAIRMAATDTTVITST